MRVHARGMEVLGGCEVVGQQTERALLIRVRNAAELARSQGALASLAQAVAPQTVEAKVFSTMRNQLTDSLRAKNVDATVEIVDPVGWHPSGLNWRSILLDVGLATGGAFLGWYLTSRKRR